MRQPGIVHVQSDAVAGQAKIQPRRDACPEVATVRSGGQEYREWLALGDGLCQHRCVCSRGVDRQSIAGCHHHYVCSCLSQRSRVTRALLSPDDERCHTTVQCVRDRLRCGQHLERNGAQPALVRLSNNPQLRSAACARSVACCVRGIRWIGIGVERTSLNERCDRLPGHLCRGAFVDELALARRFDLPNLRDPGRRARRPELRNVIGEHRGSQFGNLAFLGGAHRIARGLRIMCDPLGDRHQQRQRAFQDLRSVLQRALSTNRATLSDLQPADRRDLGDAQHLRDFRPHLPGLRIDAVVAEQDEVVLLAGECECQRAGRRQCVRARECEVVQVERVVSPHRQASHETAPCLGWPHRVDRDTAAQGLLQFDRAVDREYVVGVQFARYAFPDEAFRLRVEAYSGYRGHPLYADGYPHASSCGTMADCRTV